MLFSIETTERGSVERDSVETTDRDSSETTEKGTERVETTERHSVETTERGGVETTDGHATLVDILYTVPAELRVGRERREELTEAQRRMRKELMMYRRTAKVGKQLNYLHKSANQK